jgi:hypothetical protein
LSGKKKKSESKSKKSSESPKSKSKSKSKVAHLKTGHQAVRSLIKEVARRKKRKRNLLFQKMIFHVKDLLPNNSNNIKLKRKEKPLSFKIRLHVFKYNFTP